MTNRLIAMTALMAQMAMATAQTAQFSHFKYEGRDALYSTAIDRSSQYVNPIMPGFYPDPSVCRVGNEYYMVNSSFGYFPGVPIFKSDNLVDWQQIGHVLDRPSQLPLPAASIGGGGIYAPSISYNPSNKTYYMTTMNMTTFQVFYVKSQNPEEGWSEPIQMKRGGMDTSFFFDTDGKAYVVYNHSPLGGARYEGQTAIHLNEFDWRADSVMLETHEMTTGSSCVARANNIEGPHVYKVGKYYYLMCAEQGTGFTHSEVIFRSKNILGPWEECPHNPILTQRNLTYDQRPDPVTCTGHAELVQTPEGEWWAVFHGCRPYKIDRSVWEPDYYNTGRETFLLPVEWTSDGWPIILKPGQAVPRICSLGSSRTTTTAAQATNFTDRFDSTRLNDRWLFLRNPQMNCYDWSGDGIAMTATPSRLDGKESPTALLCRQRHLAFSAETEVSFTPQGDSDLAGMAVFQNEQNHFVLGKTRLDGKLAVTLTRVVKGKTAIVGSRMLNDGEAGRPIRMKVEADGRYYSFYCAVADGPWTTVAEGADGQCLSTHEAGGFVGTTVGIYVTGNGDISSGWTFWSESCPEKRVAVTLPHDAMQTEKRSADVEGGHHSGYFPGGAYHYERTIEATPRMLEQHITLQFEGVYQKARVSINGHPAGGTAYGYTPFTVSLDGLLHLGNNTLRVDVDNSQTPNSRWYTGAGIYRPVHLRVQEATHLSDVKISTKSIAPATIHVAANHNGGEVTTTVLYRGQTVARAEGDDIDIIIPDALLWSADHPNLYQVKVELSQQGKAIEQQTYDYGIRQIEWSSNGLTINGEPTLLRGGCLHHDNGLLGACEYDDAAERRIRLLKEYGFNAIRSAHNPCSEAVLRACDRLGMYVMDELWDVWYDHKTPADYATDFLSNYTADIEAMVAKDYNHPSVIIYSIANEPTEPAKEEGVAMGRDIVARLHALDPSRPATAGINMVILYMNSIGISLPGTAAQQGGQKMTSEQYNAQMANAGNRLMMAVLKPEVDKACRPIFDALDIAGYNYGNRRYEADATEHPDRIVIGTETYSYSLSENWEQVVRLPYLVGDFMWTAWDYIGESGIGAWHYSDEEPTSTKPYPWLLAGAGALDLLGHPTGEALRAKAVWLADDKPYVGVRPIHDETLLRASWRGTNAIPSWSWRGCDGMPTQVEVFTSAPWVRLYINDRLVGEQEVNNHVATFDVAYEPGTLRAVSVSADGSEQSATLSSATGQLGLTLTPDKPSCLPGELVYIDIDITGENGEIESKCDAQLSVEVSGATLLGFGSARPLTDERFTSGSYTTYYGRAQAIVRAGSRGSVSIAAFGDDAAAKLCIPIAQ